MTGLCDEGRQGEVGRDLHAGGAGVMVRVGSIAHYRLVGGQADAVSREPVDNELWGWGSGNPEAERAGGPAG